MELAIKSGRDADGRRVNVPCQNVVVQNCNFANGHGGITIGSEITGGVKNVYARDLSMNSANLQAGHRIKTNTLRGGYVLNTNVYRVTAGTVGGPLLLVQGNYNGQHPYTQLLLSAVPDPKAPPPSAAALAAASGERGEPPKVIDPAPGCRFQPRCPVSIDACATITPELKPLAAAHAPSSPVPPPTEGGELRNWVRPSDPNRAIDVAIWSIVGASAADPVGTATLEDLAIATSTAPNSAQYITDLVAKDVAVGGVPVTGEGDLSD